MTNQCTQCGEHFAASDSLGSGECQDCFEESAADAWWELFQQYESEQSNV